MHAQATSDCRSQHQLNLRLLRFTASPQREEPVMLAQDLLAAQRPVDALEVVETAMERDPEDADLLLTLGVALLKSDELKWARRVLTQAVSADPEWAEPWRWLGEALLKSEDQERAIRALQKAQALDGTDQSVAKLLKSITRWDELSRRLRRYFSRPELVDPALLLQDLLEDGRLEEAEEVLAIALAEDDDDPDLLLLRSRVERARGDFDAARSSLSRATELDPGWEEAWHDLEGLLVEMGEDDAARSVALTAKEAERAAMEEALAERVAREKALAVQKAHAARQQQAQRDAERAVQTIAEEEARAEEEAKIRGKQAILARAAAEAEARGKEAAKAALLRATADARAAAAERTRQDRERKAAEVAAVRAAEVAEQTRLDEERQKRDEAFQRAWDEAEKVARDRLASQKAEKDAHDRLAAQKAEEEALAKASQAALAEGLRRAREAIWQQAKVEAERRIADSPEPNPEDLEKAAFARAREELEAEGRRAARRAAVERARQEEEARAALVEERERDAALAKARKAAAAQRHWEATSASREAAANRALALAMKIATDAKKRDSTPPPAPVSVQTVEDAEPVFELKTIRPIDSPAPSASDVDAMLDDLLGSIVSDGVVSDTLPGMPAPAGVDGGVGMTQGPTGLRVRDQGCVPYQPQAMALAYETAPGIPAALEAFF